AHWVFDRGRLTGHLPERGQYLTVVSSAVPELMDIRGRELVEHMRDELTGRFGDARLLWSRVSREPAATFAGHPGTAARRPGDGTWAIWFEGPGDLDTTIEAYAALKLAGVDPGPRARDFIRRNGGIPRARIFTKCFLALLGQWPWQRIVPIPPEVVLLPPSGPVSVYHFACWARCTFVPLAVTAALRPVRGADVDLREIGARPGQSRPAPRPGRRRPP